MTDLLSRLAAIAYAQTPKLDDFKIIKILAVDDINQLIANIIGLVLLIAGIVAFGYVIISGFQYMTAGGDAAKAAGARQHIINAVIGLVIISLSWAILSFVAGRLFGGSVNTGGGGSGGQSTQQGSRSPYYTTSDPHNTGAVIINGALKEEFAADPGMSWRYGVKLATKPSQEVTLNLSLQGDLASQLQLSKSMITFNDSNWDQEQTFTVTYNGEGKSGQKGRIVLKSDQLEYRQFINFLTLD